MDPVARIENLRRARAAPDVDLSIAATIRQTAETASRTHRRLGELIDLWSELIPADLAQRTQVKALRGGVAYIDVETAPDLYEIDRLLRDGVEAEMRRRFGGSLIRVRLKVGRG